MGYDGSERQVGRKAGIQLVVSTWSRKRGTRFQHFEKQKQKYDQLFCNGRPVYSDHGI